MFRYARRINPILDPATLSDPAWAERQVAMLAQLAEAGLRIALEAAARAASPDADINAVAMAYARASRAVRMSVLLQARLREEAPEPEAPLDEEFEAREGHKLRVERIVERVAKAEWGLEDERNENLMYETGERLDNDDVYGDVMTRPVGELVALICKDLGLEPDWAALSREAWAKAEIAAAPEGSPFLAEVHRVLPRQRGSCHEVTEGEGGAHTGPLRPFGSPPPRVGEDASGAHCPTDSS